MMSDWFWYSLAVWWVSSYTLVIYVVLWTKRPNESYHEVFYTNLRLIVTAPITAIAMATFIITYKLLPGTRRWWNQLIQRYTKGEDT